MLLYGKRAEGLSLSFEILVPDPFTQRLILIKTILEKSGNLSDHMCAIISTEDILPNSICFRKMF
jgi:hypothetical protein